MSTRPINRRLSSRHASSDRLNRQMTRDALEDNDLTRTRSHDLSVVESTAVREAEPDETKSDVDGSEASVEAPKWPSSVQYLIMLCAFLTSTSFGVTQVPLLYVFRLMTCDEYYKTHSSPVLQSTAATADLGALNSVTSFVFNSLTQTPGVNAHHGGDRCSVRWIESDTALQISLVGATTTIFGIMNLFITGALIKRIGLKTTLVINVASPAIRLVIQNIGVEVWGRAGIYIIQASQVVTILGGPSGYLLVLNSFITEVVEYEARTAALGKVAGCMMFGSALGFLLGGVIAEVINIHTPFRLTLALFVLSAIYVQVVLPYVPPAESKTDKDSPAIEDKGSRLKKIFAPLIVFAPKKFVTREGKIQTEYGTFLLAWGVFLGILATGYLPTLLQLYSTDVFGFGTKENGYLIFMYSALRGSFLTFAFPRVISLGRKLTGKPEKTNTMAADSEASERDPLLSANTHPNDEHHGHKQPQEQTFAFDLIYTRFSLLADGLLTLLCSFVHQGWQLYLVSAILPFSAGTGSAAKGTVLQMVGSSASSAERTDALAGLSLVENMARLSTTFVFGVIFAAFAAIGRHDLVFTCNAAVAVFGFFVLFLARFPPEGSQRLDRIEGLNGPEQ